MGQFLRRCSLENCSELSSRVISPIIKSRILRSSSVLGPPARRVNSTMASSLLKKARRGNRRQLRSHFEEAYVFLEGRFPKLKYHDPTDTWFQLRSRIYGDLQVIRKLRDRIAHHEPIFTRNLRRTLSEFTILSVSGHLTSRLGCSVTKTPLD
jgi:hypothetical protein